MSVIHNMQRPESMLRKKSNAICYHAVRESVAMGESLTGHIKTTKNPDLAKKVMANGQKRRSWLTSFYTTCMTSRKETSNMNKSRTR